jgi:hypothetical protein
LHDDQQGLEDDPARHLGLADAPVAERDRGLADSSAEAARAVRHLDLEHVAAGVDAVERDRGECCGAPRLEPPGQVPHPQPQDQPGEEAAAARDDLAADAPVLDSPALDVARTDDEVGPVGFDELDHARQHGRVVRPVGVHLDHDRSAARQGDAESVDVGAPKALLPWAMTDPDPRVSGGQVVGDLPGSIR